MSSIRENKSKPLVTVVLVFGLPGTGKTYLINSIKSFVDMNTKMGNPDTKELYSPRNADSINKQGLDVVSKALLSMYAKTEIIPIIYDELIPNWSVPQENITEKNIILEKSINKKNCDYLPKDSIYKDTRDKLLIEIAKKIKKRTREQKTFNSDSGMYFDKNSNSMGDLQKTNDIVLNISGNFESSYLQQTNLANPVSNINASSTSEKPSLDYDGAFLYGSENETFNTATHSGGTENLIYFIEDVFLYYSMRKSWFNFCVENDVVFMQMHLVANRSERHSRNTQRPLNLRNQPNAKYRLNSLERPAKIGFRVPQEIMNNLESKFEAPNQHKSWWESKFTCTINTSNSQLKSDGKYDQPTESSNVSFVLASLRWIEENMQAFLLEQKEHKTKLELREIARQNTEKSGLHQIHILLKILVAEYIKKIKEPRGSTCFFDLSNVEISVIAKRLNFIKDQCFFEIKSRHASGDYNSVSKLFLKMCKADHELSSLLCSQKLYDT